MSHFTAPDSLDRVRGFFKGIDVQNCRAGPEWNCQSLFAEGLTNRKVAYIIDQANAVAATLERFTTAHAYQAAGQHANVGFWIDETLHALDALGTYAERFERLSAAQSKWIGAHNVVVGSYCARCKGQCEFDPNLRPPRGPTLIPSEVRNEATRRLRDAMDFFLLRCYRMKLIDEPQLRKVCARVGTAVESRDLVRK